MNDEQKIKCLQQIIRTGLCGINPPLMGWLIAAGIMTQSGFDANKAQNELLRLTTPEI